MVIMVMLFVIGELASWRTGELVNGELANCEQRTANCE